jgi:hypothetical protein
MALLSKDSIIKENFFKNFVIVVLVFLFYGPISNSLATLPSEAIGDFLFVISILLVTVSFANFAFTYESSKMNTVGSTLLSHSATFVFMLLTALLLEVMVIAIGDIYPSLYVLTIIFSIILYIGIILYDFWDLFRQI